MSSSLRFCVRTAYHLGARGVRMSPTPLVAFQQQVTSFSTRRTTGRKISRPRKSDDDDSASLAVPPPAPMPVDPADAWVEVVDKPSGRVYWWNTVTNETTALDAPRPLGPTALGQPMQQQPVQQGGMLSGLGSVMAQGFAFGTGSAVAHNVVGSMFGGSSSSSDSSSSSGDSVDGDSWDV